MFKDIDFLSGEVSFAFDEKIEDMLWVDCPNNYVLEMKRIKRTTINKNRASY